MAHPRTFSAAVLPAALLLLTTCGHDVTAPPAPTQLVFIAQPRNIVAGHEFSQALQVQAEDARGNKLGGFIGNVTVALASNPGGSTLSGTTTVGAVDGIAIFYNLSLDKTGAGYTLTASASGGGLAAPTSAAFDVAPGPATQLEFTVEPTTVTAGAPLAPPLQVSALDPEGNPVPGFTGNVTVAFGGTSGAGATLGGTTTVAAVHGVATFGDLTVSKAGTGYWLTGSSTGLGRAASDAFEVTAGAATQLVVGTPPGTTVAEHNITPAVKVRALDAFGNLVPSFTGNVSIATGTNPGGATLSGTTPVAAIGGVATFYDLSLNKTATGYTLTASGSGFAPVTSAPFDITPGAATQLAFTAQPTNTVAGAIISAAVQVTALDPARNAGPGFTGSVTVAYGNHRRGGHRAREHPRRRDPQRHDAGRGGGRRGQLLRFEPQPNRDGLHAHGERQCIRSRLQYRIRHHAGHGDAARLHGTALYDGGRRNDQPRRPGDGARSRGEPGAGLHRKRERGARQQPRWQHARRHDHDGDGERRGELLDPDTRQDGHGLLAHGDRDRPEHGDEQCLRYHAGNGHPAGVQPAARHDGRESPHHAGGESPGARRAGQSRNEFRRQCDRRARQQSRRRNAQRHDAGDRGEWGGHVLRFEPQQNGDGLHPHRERQRLHHDHEQRVRHHAGHRDAARLHGAALDDRRRRGDQPRRPGDGARSRGEPGAGLHRKRERGARQQPRWLDARRDHNDRGGERRRELRHPHTRQDGHGLLAHGDRDRPEHGNEQCLRYHAGNGDPARVRDAAGNDRGGPPDQSGGESPGARCVRQPGDRLQRLGRRRAGGESQRRDAQRHDASRGGERGSDLLRSEPQQDGDGLHADGEFHWVRPRDE